MSLVEWMALVSAAVGAFLGSFSAFMLENQRQRRTEKQRQLSALQEALFALGSQLAALKGLRQVNLDPVRNEPERHSKLGRILFEVSDLRVRAQDVAFLVGQGERELLSSIDECRTMFENSLTAMRRREEALHRAYFSDGCEIHDFDMSTGRADITPNPLHVFDLRVLTDSLFECFDTAIECHETAFPLLRSLVESRE